MMLPIYEILPQLKAALAARSEAVLVAAPGAGKTTVVPLELMTEPWVADRRIIVLEPRRLAARAAAERMSASVGDKPGGIVGYRIRLGTKVTSRTRVELVTEGVFTRMILEDPGLDGIACVIFDEFHERSLDADLGLALARDSQQVLRPDLRILVMSATLDAARVADLLGGAPVIESHGRQHPVRTTYLGREHRLPLDEHVGRTVLKALAEEVGSQLVFLPGAPEIRRTESWLLPRLKGAHVDLAPLHGSLDPKEQDAAVRPAAPQRRKVVLASAIAETSLTIEGVRVVIDSGLSRVPSFDPSSGLTRLKTVRVTQASANQRRGRAGRTEPGVCYRLWDEAETRGLIPFPEPEILETDLSRLALDLARWGARDATELAFLDPPPRAAMQEARTLLHELGALDGQGNLTAHGRGMAELPLPPRLAHMLLWGAEHGAARLAGRIAVLLMERGLGGSEVDLALRLEDLARDRSTRARDSRQLAERLSRHASAGLSVEDAEIEPGVLMATAFPERIAHRRGKRGEFRLASGRGVWVDPAEPLAGHAWLSVGELGASDARDRILLAAALDEHQVRHAFDHLLRREEAVETDDGGRLRAVHRVRLGELVLEERRMERPPPELLVRHLMAQVRRLGPSILPWSGNATSLRARVVFARQRLGEGWPDLSDAALAQACDDWLPPLLHGLNALSQIEPEALDSALKAMVTWPRLRELERLAPARLSTPAGSSYDIDYAADGGPRCSVRPQALFGLDQHPAVLDGKALLVLELLSPGGRPIQLTQDLPGFWRGSWSEIAKEMRGRYPKHPWPDEPWTAEPTLRAKERRELRRGG